MFNFVIVLCYLDMFDFWWWDEEIEMGGGEIGGEVEFREGNVD